MTFAKVAIFSVTVVVSLNGLPLLHAHHEAIFGPQSATLIAKKRYVSAQYYFSNEGRRPDPLSHSHISILSAGTSVGERWAASITLPVEAERGVAEARATGVQDLVAGVRYFPEMPLGQTLMGIFTFEPPTGNLEHRAVGFGGGVVYGVERAPWSIIFYGLGRTESSLEDGRKRGNRVFLGSGLAYETSALPFSPQLGISWERAGRTLEDGLRVPGSEISVLMLHPTVMKEFNERFQAFGVVSLPAGQWSGHEGWQRFRIAAGVIWSF
ncbi:MAG: hypothetical protein ACRD88_10480 [Terriglobia bacterium]